MSGKKRRSNHGITLVSLLFVTVLLIAGYLLYTNHKQEKEEEAAKAEKERQAAANTTFCINEEENQFELISIQTSDGTIALKENEDKWQLEDEVEFPLDQGKVEEISETLAKLSVSKTVVEAASDLGEFGLSQPSTVITAKCIDGSEFTLNIGDQLNISTDYYCSVGEQNTVYVLPFSVGTKLLVSKEDLFYIPEDISLNASQIREIQLSTKTQGNFHLIYDENNPFDYTGMNKYKWYSADNNRYPINVDEYSVSSLLEDFSNYSIQEGIDYGMEAMKTYGLTDPEGTIYLRYVDENDSNKEVEYRIHLGNHDEAGNYYISLNDDQVVYFMLTYQLTDKLAYKESDIIGNYTQLVDIRSVSNMQITSESVNDTYTFENLTATDEDGNEKISTTFKKNGVLQDESEFRKFYTKVISLRKSGLLTYDDTVSGQLRLTIHFTLSNGRELMVCYYDYDDDNYAVTINGNAQFTADKSEIDEFMQSL